MQPQEGSLIASLLPLIGLLGIFYFLLIRPQQKQAREHRAMIDGLSKGDKIITNGGLIAKIVKVEEEFLSVELAEGTVVKLQKEFVSKKVDAEEK